MLSIRRMNIVPKERIMELCGVTKGVDERIDEDVLQWFGYVKRIENDKDCEEGVYRGVCR